jgi:hypothetical protein
MRPQSCTERVVAIGHLVLACRRTDCYAVRVSGTLALITSSSTPMAGYEQRHRDLVRRRMSHLRHW